MMHIGPSPNNYGIFDMKLNKRSKKYHELHDLWLETEPYLCKNDFKPIEEINKAFYQFLIKYNFPDEWDCWSICEKYITGKSYRTNIKYEIFPYAGEFGIRLIGSDRLIAIRNTKKQINKVLNYLKQK